MVPSLTGISHATGAILSNLHIFNYSILMATSYCSHFQTRKLRPRGAKPLAWSPLARNSGDLVPEAIFSRGKEPAFLKSPLGIHPNT
jgi:hypothetical protein